MFSTTWGKQEQRALVGLTRLQHLTLGPCFYVFADTAAIASLPLLTKLQLCETFVGVAGARTLASLPQLQHLALSECRVGAEGAAAIAAMTGLTGLVLDRERLVDRDARALSGMRRLRYLRLDGNKLGPSGAASLAPLTALTMLSLRRNAVQQGVCALTTLTGLCNLNLGECVVGDAGAVRIAGALTRLTALFLDTNRVGRAGLCALAWLQQLGGLHLAKQLRNAVWWPLPDNPPLGEPEELEAPPYLLEAPAEPEALSEEFESEAAPKASDADASEAVPGEFERSRSDSEWSVSQPSESEGSSLGVMRGSSEGFSQGSESE